MHVDGPALVLAGAGSGKTRVLAERVCNLVKYGKARSYEILALTFTNKAAEEMKARINSLLGKRYDFPWVGTFHSICFRLLRENIRELRPKYKTNFTIYDPSDQNTVIKRAIEKLEFDLDRYNSKSIRTKLDSLKNDYTNLDELVDNIQDENELNIMKLYQSILIDNNAMDFGDLLVNFYELIHTNEGVKKNYTKDLNIFLLMNIKIPTEYNSEF
jgi:DNA helicase-2/ATP-dependent DNA helicase PcrA